jgi:hypothetical protein
MAVCELTVARPAVFAVSGLPAAAAKFWFMRGTVML